MKICQKVAEQFVESPNPGTTGSRKDRTSFAPPPPLHSFPSPFWCRKGALFTSTLPAPFLSTYWSALPVSSLGSTFITIAEIRGDFLDAFTDTGRQSSLLEHDTE